MWRRANARRWGEHAMMRKAVAALLCLILAAPGPAQAKNDLTPVEARAIAKEAFVFGFPLVDSYRVQYSYFVDRGAPEFKRGWNTLFNNARVYTPEDKSIQTPNSDTPYSYVGADLRAEPLVFSVPAIEKERYYSLQFIDMNTYNFAYVGSRTTGNGAGRYLLAGPGWKGGKPAGVDAVIRSDTDFAFVLYRTQLFNPDDIDKVKAIQAGYKVETLSQYLGAPQRKAWPAIAFARPLSREEQVSSPEFFNVLNFILQFAPADPSEKALRQRFARLGIAPGKLFDPDALPAPILDAVKQGMADAWAELAAFKASEIDTRKVTSADLFGTRAALKNNYLYRMAGAALGIYGNSRQEAIYPAYTVDAAGDPLDGAKHAYRLRFAPGQLPPAEAFWSLTLYELPASLLYANPINRYLINSPMLPDLKRDADGGITLYLQHDSPGPEKESNWLPAPAGPFWTTLRLYRPQPAALDGKWKQPPLEPSAALEPGKEGLVTVTPKTYIRAESDRSFGNIQALAGGVNQFYRIREPTPLDGQTVIRMNRDTLYSAAIVDTSKGATVTLPEVRKGRFISALIIDNDHYAPAVFYEPGTHPIPSDTKYALVAVRIQLFDPANSKEIALVNALQDELKIEAGSDDPFVAPHWDEASLKALTAQYNKEGASYSSWKGMMGPRGTVNEETRHIAAAAAWGLNPEKDATYLNYGGAHDPGKCYQATYKVPENNAFWSITVYGDDGYMKSANNIVNSSNVKLDGEGGFTVFFGSKALCGDKPNRLDVTPGWNFLMRIYRPGGSVLDGRYTLPAAQPAP
jgi:hypothetical protein